jgi:drug/metabolite transporter (DMT)-like permease
MTTTADFNVFAWLYAGALLITGATSLISDSWNHFNPSSKQWATLAYLGILSSGICFFLWNRGATQVNSGTLAALNNAKIPLGVACSLLVFHEEADPIRLIFGGSLLGTGVWLAERKCLKVD